MKTEGQCACGAVTFRVEGEPLAQAICHCPSCCRAHAAPMIEAAIFPAEAFTVAGPTRCVTVTDEPSATRRHVCQACGTKVYNQPVDSVRTVFPALCADRDWYGAQMHLYWSTRSMEVADDLPKYLDFPERFGGSGKLAGATRLSELVGTCWEGSAELWLDPLGDQAQRSDCALTIEEGALRYTWSHDGKPQQGSFTLVDGGADFEDTFHQSQGLMRCRALPNDMGLLQVQGAYGPGADWGWRTGLFLREPTGELVLQMTNICPWGEEARAVRMVCKRTERPAG